LDLFFLNLGIDALCAGFGKKTKDAQRRMKLHGAEIAWCAVMLFSSTLVILYTHAFVRRVCNGSKTAPIYYLALPLLAYACTTLFAIGAQLLTIQRQSIVMHTAAAYGLLWATQDQGPVLRQCLTKLGNLYVCYLLGLILGVLLMLFVTDPRSTLSVLLLGLLAFQRLCPNFEGSWASVFPTKL
jgi:hypothetical protein